MRLGAPFAAALLLVLTLGVATATAVPPVTEESVRFDASITEPDDFFSEFCGFPVTFSAKGHFSAKIYFNRDGSIKRFVNHPSFRQTLSSPFGSITTDDRGLDKFTLQQDGTFLVFGTGIHLRIKGVAYAIGLWRLVFDPVAEELVSEEYHGNFDLRQPEIDQFICDQLGPPA
jgi:hypothetical protein